MKIDSVSIACRSIATLTLMLAITSCTQEITPEDKLALMKKELGIDSDRFIDNENIDHLVFLHRFPTAIDKKQAAASVTLGKELIADGSHLFAEIEYRAALETYPTPEVVLAFGNGYLRVAQHHLDRKQPDLAKVLGNNDVRWYFKGSAFYYDLALRFAERIDQPFGHRQQQAITAAMACIARTLADPKTNIDRPCKLVE